MNKIVRTIMKASYLLILRPSWFFRLAKARLRPLPEGPVIKKINGVVFEFDFDYDPEIKLMYSGTYEMETVDYMRRFLKKGGTFIDVGANIGYLSAVAMGIVGHTGQVHSIEPVPQYFQRLKKIAMANKGHRIIVSQCAMGEEEGRAKVAVTNLRNIGWNTTVPNLMSRETVKETIDVPMYRLDTYIQRNFLDEISMIKIDTEGFELPILKGLSGYLERAGCRPPIICEIAPDAYPLLGYALNKLAEYMAGFGYYAFDVNRNRSRVDVSKIKKTRNVIFISKKRKA